MNQSSNIERDTVVVKNLPPTITWQELRDKFRNCGDIKFAEIKGKGDIGLVRFDSEWTAKRAIGKLLLILNWTFFLKGFDRGKTEVLSSRKSKSKEGHDHDIRKRILSV
jgi:RNA-binding proteins (RRM domain)